MSVGEVSGYVAATLVFMTFYMKTMVPLRVIGICSNCAFITYGFIGGLYPVLILHAILLPLNSLRLREMLQLTKQVRAAAHGDPKRQHPEGDQRRLRARGSSAPARFMLVAIRFLPVVVSRSSR
jgi:hypothetical protein